MTFEDLINQTVDGFKIKRKLGEGAYGVTFEAEDSLGGLVAIKIIKEDTPDWKREAQKAAKVRNVPQIASVHTVDSVTITRDEEEVLLHYIVWEFVNGTTLNDFLSSNSTISSTMIVDLTQEICRGIKAMQDVGLEHGDLHPGNIILVAPHEWDPVKKHTIKIVDFGLAKSMRREFTSDMDYLKSILDKCWKLNQSYGDLEVGPDKKFHGLLVELLARMCDENPERRLADPVDVINRIDEIQRQSGGTESFREVKLSHPFEFLNAEEMPENSDLVHLLYADNVPWIREIADFGTTLISGPRGSGKSMILKNMRLLTNIRSNTHDRYLANRQYLGFYAHCQHSLYYPFAGIPINHNIQTCDMFVHYLNLILTAEILESLILLERLDLHVLSQISKTKISDFLRHHAFQDNGEFISLNPESLLQHCKSVTEKEIIYAQSKISKNISHKKMTRVNYLAELIDMLDGVSDLFSNKQIYFLLDDYSNPRVPFILQKSINRIIGYRNNRFCFKITTEKFGFTPDDSDGKAMQLDREYSYVDLGSRYAKAKSKEKKDFIMRILENRLRRAKIDLGAGQFFESHNGEKIAVALRRKRADSKSNARGEVLYAGFDTIFRLCMGDISTILQLCKEIYMMAKSKEDPTCGISAKLQDSVIRDFSKKRLNMIKEHPYTGIDLYNLVESFGNISQRYLYDYPSDDNSKFYEVLRMELTEGTDCLSLETGDLFKNLIREHIFIEGGLSPSWGKGFGNAKLILRPIYTPALEISYADRYSIKMKCAQLKNFLEDPGDFENSLPKFSHDSKDIQNTLTLDDYGVSLRPDADDE